MKPGKGELATAGLRVFALTITMLMAVAGVMIFCIGLQNMADAIDAGLLPPCVREAFTGVTLLICSLILHPFLIVSKKREEL